MTTSTRAVAVALIVDFVIGAAKLVAFLFTGSTAIMAEVLNGRSVHRCGRVRRAAGTPTLGARALGARAAGTRHPSRGSTFGLEPIQWELPWSSKTPQRSSKTIRSSLASKRTWPRSPPRPATWTSSRIEGRRKPARPGLVLPLDRRDHGNVRYRHTVACRTILRVSLSLLGTARPIAAGT